MKFNTQGLAFAIGLLSAFLIAGCKQEPPVTQAPPPVKRAQPAGQLARSEVARPQPAPADGARPQSTNPASASARQPSPTNEPATTGDAKSALGQPAGDASHAVLAPSTGDGGATLAQDPAKPANPQPDAKPAKPQQPDAAKPTNPPATQPAPHQPGATAGEPAKLEGNQLTHGGITMTVPAGWQKADAGPATPMGPKAVFTIAGEGGAAVTVRITHFPEMKGPERDEANVNRWLGQVTKADGSPTKREEAKIETKEKGPVRLIIVDAAGTVKATMRDTAQPDSRLIAAIVDHPKGPHFVVASGPAALMDKSAANIRAFIESAKVQ
jgi:hypothetical protein